MLIRLAQKSVPSTCRYIVYLYAIEDPPLDANPSFLPPSYVNCGAYFAKNTTLDSAGAKKLSDYCDSGNGDYVSRCTMVQAGFAAVICMMLVTKDHLSAPKRDGARYLVDISPLTRRFYRIILIPMAILSWITDHRNPARDEVLQSVALNQTNVIPIGGGRTSRSETSPPPPQLPANGNNV